MIDSYKNINEPNWIIEANALTKNFNKQVAVEDLSVQIPQNAIFGFIGPSGSGKTTTVRLLLGIYPPSSGDVEVFGHKPHRFTQNDRRKIGYMPQLFILQDGLTVRQNLSFTASLYGLIRHRKKRIKETLNLVELTGHEKKRARDLSGGMQRRLSLAAALLHSPELIFLDEPTAGIDPVLRKKFWNHFHELKKQGHTLFITTQYVAEAAYCDYVGVMSDGRLIMVETPQNLKRIGMGGELIELIYENELRENQIEQIRNQNIIKQWHIQSLDHQRLKLIVDDAAEVLPLLLNWFQENEITVKEAQKLEPTFDDVFVQLIERHRKNA
ncbi:MAG: ABC transporter [Anaerolineaceae bacterium]|nr:ABC transporter [Anaerolineaceae bacterium]